MRLEIQTDKVLIDYEISADIFSIFDQKKILLEAVASGKPIEVKTDKIERIDTASLQLMLSFKQTAELKQLPIKFDKPSSSFINMANLMGMSVLLNIQGN